MIQDDRSAEILFSLSKDANDFVNRHKDEFSHAQIEKANFFEKRFSYYSYSSLSPFERSEMCGFEDESIPKVKNILDQLVSNRILDDQGNRLGDLHDSVDLGLGLSDDLFESLQQLINNGTYNKETIYTDLMKIDLKNDMDTFRRQYVESSFVKTSQLLSKKILK